ncbi:FAD-dependent monooxygenase [Kitasatospora viridis]|uniref:2-polyprenyl-6-methoxyphenol hydroxylase-like FAD-dependent oxidoreductase n=1 Tax=Kitasatospora viridis TaxID=281105 RepID=A0A561SF27_9ACTN|nr:FAD-dependent monooxygenase [Kitasatospora viridis]TWF73471.1 2-polyprenyl-6-methoxyphenol hydroxylase-like FAD-dependent oxidoreductase [Kitasatospora viridis]
MSRTSHDVVVVGAGPTGLALAIGLRQYGLSVAVLEKEDSSKRQPRAGVVWQRALEVLADLGCAERFLAHGIPLHSSELVVSGRPLGVLRMAVPGTRFPHPLSIEQDVMERLLGERLVEVGGAVEWSTEAVAVRVGPGGAEVDARGPDGAPRTLRCAWVVGCEGAHSLVRKALGVPFDGGPRPNLQVVQLNARAEWPFPEKPGHSYLFLERGMSAGAAPRPGGGYRFYGFTADPDQRPLAPPSVDEMRDYLVRVSHAPRLRLTPTDPPWSNRARFQDRFARTLRSGRGLLAGDSAHLWAPVSAHGLNTGLRGAHNLAWKLAGVQLGWARQELLDTYASEQRLTALRVLRMTRRDRLELPATRFTMLSMRLIGGRLVSGRRSAGRIRSRLSDLDQHHRESALSVGAAGGDRLPDLPVWCRGRWRRLHELLDYQRWTLLRVTGSDRADRQLERLLAAFPVPVRVHTLLPSLGHEHLLPADSLVLVRPDSHIALAAHHPEEVAAYLARWFVRR